MVSHVSVQELEGLLVAERGKVSATVTRYSANHPPTAFGMCRASISITSYRNIRNNCISSRRRPGMPPSAVCIEPIAQSSLNPNPNPAGEEDRKRMNGPGGFTVGLAPRCLI